ncbi:MAG TPA: histidine kinase [Cyclobacteriaceae bacterium]|nr:histidine kinase [Cyclobacteriaceae bacterium]
MALKKINWASVAKTVTLHLLFWMLVIIYYAWGFGLDVDPKRAFLTSLSFFPGHVIMVYVLLYFLIPKYLLQRKFWHFLIGFVILVFICATYAGLAQLTVNSVKQFAGVSVRVGRNVLPFVHVGGIAASIKLLKYWYLQRKQTIEAEQQRTVAELKLLKAQLHPHFLFNTLNNLYSHTLEFSPKSPEIVLKLSGLLRFMIYESNVARIPLSKEIELLRDYISLEQLRYGDRLDMSITVTGEVERYQIAPLLLLPFLENAFKHGTSMQIDQCWISFNLSMEDNFLSFKLLNSIDPSAGKDYSEHKGIGLDNVIRRLQLLYKDDYQFETVMMDEVFVVNLGLPLEKLEEQFVDKLHQLA